ncbi:uncharacterized protein [Ptychodera flava]|uniref:uncharacterized protein isoform X1 n=1 Tax=Ptychodera flava TaxID=63121 RepID=UPI00396A2BAC
MEISGPLDKQLSTEVDEVRRSHRIREKQNLRKQRVKTSDNEDEDEDDDDDDKIDHRKMNLTVNRLMKMERVVIHNSPELRAQWLKMKQLSGFSSDKEFLKHLLDMERQRLGLATNSIILANSNTTEGTDIPQATSPDSNSNSDGESHYKEAETEKSDTLKAETYETDAANSDTVVEKPGKVVPNGTRFPARNERRAVSDVGLPGSFSCKECGRCYKTYGGLFLHIRVHKGKKEFKCTHSDCSYESYYKANLEKHIATVHENKPPQVKKMKCRYCGKMYRKCRLEIHIRSHTGEKPYCCEMCGKMFASQHDLTRHQYSLHSVGSPHACTYNSCDETFKTKTQLQEHECKVHRGTKFPCPDEKCGKVFSLKRYLKKHMTTHSDTNKKYACTWAGCTRAFRERRNLKVHYLTHTDEKPLKCNFCDFKCRQRASIKWHLKKCQQQRKFLEPRKDGKKAVDQVDVCNLCVGSATQQMCCHSSSKKMDTDSNYNETAVDRAPGQVQVIQTTEVENSASMISESPGAVLSVTSKAGLCGDAQDADNSEISMSVVHILVNMDSTEHSVQVPTSNGQHSPTNTHTVQQLQTVVSDPSDEVASAAATLQSIAVPSATDSNNAETTPGGNATLQTLPEHVVPSTQISLPAMQEQYNRNQYSYPYVRDF